MIRLTPVDFGLRALSRLRSRTQALALPRSRFMKTVENEGTDGRALGIFQLFIPTVAAAV
jgi:hypothetical protein